LDPAEIIPKWQIEFKKGFARPLILMVLAKKENYPYQIAKEIFQMTNGELSIATSNIYPILKSLKDLKLISERKDESSRRIFYNLTENGVILLNGLVESVETFLTALNIVFHQKRDEVV
jgi:DNA-binding PadR family transcriptional regulator